MVSQTIRNRKIRILVIICALLLIVSATGIVVAECLTNPWLRQTDDFAAYCEQLIYLNENYDSANRIIVISDRRIRDRNSIASASGYGGMYVLQYASDAEAKNALEYYNSLSYVKSAMMDSAVNTQEELADGEFDTVVLDHLTWGAEILGVDSYHKAIEQKYGSANLPDVYVAVLDTGIDTDNEFLQGRIALNLGKSYYTSELYKNNQSDYDFEDDHMHGTHVAGTIVDLTLSNVKIIPIKVMNSEGTGSTSDVLAAIQYVMELKQQGINVVAMNMSLAADSYGNENTELFDRAYSNNVMSVVAAGNESYYAEQYFPANCPSALTVSALSQNVIYENFPFVSYYSNYGSNVDLCLPGTNVLSCVPDDYNYNDNYIYSVTGGKYAYLSGTSMATPHASALVALYASYMGDGYSTEKVEMALKTHVYDLGDTGRDDLFGYGVPSMDLALADKDLPVVPTLSYGEVGSSYHFDDSISVSITNNNFAYSGMNYKVYYTLDGSYPTICGNHFEYSEPIELEESTHLSFVIYLFDSDEFVRGHSTLYEIEYFKGETEDKNTNGTGFEINRNGILTRYTSGLQDVVIPEYVNDIQVRELGNNLFFGLNVRSIVCEADVSLYNKTTSTYEFPIRYCPNLKSVTLGSSNALQAVSHCFGLKELILTRATDIADAPFPSFTLGYSFLGTTTAYGCSSLERLVAYEAKAVGSYAFSYVETLKEVVLPKATAIYYGAFIECTGLTYVELDSVHNVMSTAFQYCNNLETVVSPELNYVDEYAFAYCSSLTDIQTGTATQFEAYSFLGCTSLKQLDTGSAKIIKDYAFRQCENLEFANLSSVTSIGEIIFMQCKNLKTVYCGSNSYAITKSTNWGDWIRRYGNLQYIVTDYGVVRNGLLSNFYFDRTVIDGYYVYSKSPIHKATFVDGNGEEIAVKYHSEDDEIAPPESKINDEYEMLFISWQNTETNEQFKLGDKVYILQDETFVLVDYYLYYFAYANQAKQIFATQYAKITGAPLVESDAAVQEIYSAIEQACKVNATSAQVANTTDKATTDKASVLQRVNGIVGDALCNLLDDVVLGHNSPGMVDTVASAKQKVQNACNVNDELVNLDETVNEIVSSIEAQRQADRMEAKATLRQISSDVYNQLTDERKAVVDGLYRTYDSRIDAAKYSEYEGIIAEFAIAFDLLQSEWEQADEPKDPDDGDENDQPTKPTPDPEDPDDDNSDKEDKEDKKDKDDKVPSKVDDGKVIKIVLIVVSSVVAVAIIVGICVGILIKKRKK